MALTLYVDTARWRAHQKHMLEQFPGIVPVCKEQRLRLRS